MQQDNNSKEPLPLYKVLDGQRTAGKWELGENNILDYKDEDGREYRKGHICLNAAKWSQFSIFYKHDIDEKDTECEANAAFTVLAVNNFVDAVELIELITTSPEWIKNYGGGEVDKKAKALLTKIS